MELCWCNVSEWISNEPYNFDQMVDFSINILSAIRHLSNNGQVHKDVKLENILITNRRNSIAKLADFGLIGKEGGTPGYCPMEQFQNPQPGATDIFAFGQCVLRMFCEKEVSMKLIYLPIENKNLHRTISRMIGAHHILKVVPKMMALDLTNRPGFPDIEKWLNDFKKTTPKKIITEAVLLAESFPQSMFNAGIHLGTTKINGSTIQKTAGR